MNPYKEIKGAVLRGGWRWLGVLFTWAVLLVGIYQLYCYLPNLSPEALTALIAFLGGSLASIVFTISRKGSKHTELEHKLLSNKALLSMPQNKLRYSDRISWIMAELSDFAYQKFEVDQDYFKKFAEQAKSALTLDDTQAIEKVLEHYKNDLSPTDYPQKKHLGRSDFESLLTSVGFSYCETFNQDGIQGFVCEYSTTKPEFIAVVFRGTEKNIEDWLTNLNARPFPIEDQSDNSGTVSTVHRGFYEKYLGVKEEIEAILKQITGNKNIPIFFTGHSQGGALATIAARELSQIPRYENSVCYTFGCPRVADYRYFEFMKTPVYRVVNSSDIVPTVPPGVWATALVKLLDLSSHLLAAMRMPTSLVDTLKEFIADYQDYRHFGDLRYLTDVNSKQFHRVMLLRNPHMIDSLLWFWRRVAISLGMPARQHSMAIYRRKLEKIAENRLNKKPIPDKFKNFQG
ncbi:hypothetical protein AB6D53_01920 [Vibrio splendidus]